MKAVILENRDGYSAILREDGVIEKVKKQGEVGDTIIVNPEKRRRTARIYRFAQVAAAAMFFLIAGGTARHFVFVPSSYVTMDVNPSVEFSMNRLDRVIDVTAVNEDAEEVVSSLKEGHIWGRSLEDVIGETTQLLEDFEYLNSSEDVVLFAVATDNDDVYDKISASVHNAESSNKGLTVEVIRGGTEDHVRAGELNLSVGRYLKMMESISGDGASSGESGQSAKAVPDNLTVNEFRQMPVEEILGKGISEPEAAAVPQAQNSTLPDGAATGQSGAQIENQQGGVPNAQASNQSGNQSVGQPAGQETGQMAGQETGQTGIGETGQMAGQTGNQENGQMAGQTGNQETGQMAGQTGVQENGQMAGQTGNQENGQIAEQPGNQGISQSAGQEGGQPAVPSVNQGAGPSEGTIGSGSAGQTGTQNEAPQGTDVGGQPGMQSEYQQGAALNGQPNQ